MSLQSAQLGQMTTLNVPTSIPTQQRTPAMWKQALMQVLAAGATDAVKAGVSNEFSRDYAKEAGKQESTGWDRLVHGPTTSEADIRQVRSEKGAEERLSRTLSSEEGRSRMAQEGENTRQRQGQTFTRGENAANREFQGNENATQQLAARLLSGQSEDAAMAREVAQNQAAERRLQEQLTAEAAGREAVTRHYNATTAQTQQMVDMMKKFTTPPGGVTPQGGAVKPSSYPTPYTDLGDVTGQLTPQPLPNQSHEAFLKLMAQGQGAPVSTGPAPAPVDPQAELTRQVLARILAGQPVQ